MELPQFIPQRSPVHIARLVNAVSHYIKIRECVNRQDGLSVIGDSVTLGSEVLHVTEAPITGRVLVIRGKSLVLHFLEPVRLVLGCTPIA